MLNKNKNKFAKFLDEDQEQNGNFLGFTQENVADDQEDRFLKNDFDYNSYGDKTIVVERQKQSKLQIASFVWTIISTIYTIGTVFTFVFENWVPSAFNTPLIILLVVWIIAFIVIIGLALSSRDAKKGQKAIKIYKKSLKIFKAFVNVLFVVITVISFVGVAHEGIEGFRQWIVMLFTLVVAVVQLALKLSILVIKMVLKRKGKGKKVQVVTFVNGVEKRNKFQQKILAKFYESDDDK